VEEVPVGVLVLDSGLRVVRANAAECEIAGADEATQLDRPVTDVLPWLPEGTLRQAIETGESSTSTSTAAPRGSPAASPSVCVR